MPKASTVIAIMLEMCVEGTTMAHLRHYIDLHDMDHKRLLRLLRSCQYGSVHWKLHERHGSIRIEITQGAIE